MQRDPRNRKLICPNCFNTLKWSGHCPYCHIHQSSIKNPGSAIGIKSIINDRYFIGKILGTGGFGITYLAWDTYTMEAVTVKEFFPRGYTKRLLCPPNAVTPKVGFELNFRHWLSAFIKEAQILSHIKNLSGVIKMRDFFLLNGTAYIVADYMHGMSLRKFIDDNGGRLSLRQALNVFRPVFDSLITLHKNGIIHKDISPENILVVEDKYVKLIDFGAATVFRDNTAKPYIVLKTGYSPIELYSPQSYQTQGPWIDVYQIAATLYNALTGQAPPCALDRAKLDLIKKPSYLGVKISPVAEGAIMKALSLDPHNRFNNVMNFIQILYGELPFITITKTKSKL